MGPITTDTQCDRAHEMSYGIARTAPKASTGRRCLVNGTPGCSKRTQGSGVHRMLRFSGKFASRAPGRRERRVRAKDPTTQTSSREQGGGPALPRHASGRRAGHRAASCNRLVLSPFGLGDFVLSARVWFSWYNYSLSLNRLSFQSAYFVLSQKYTFLAKVMEFAAK